MLTDYPDMTIAVYHRRKTTQQQKLLSYGNKHIVLLCFRTVGIQYN